MECGEHFGFFSAKLQCKVSSEHRAGARDGYGYVQRRSHETCSTGRPQSEFFPAFIACRANSIAGQKLSLCVYYVCLWVNQGGVNYNCYT